MKHISTAGIKKYGRTSYDILFVFIFIGIVIGSLFAVKKGAVSPWLHQFFMPLYSGSNVFEILRNTFLSSAAFVLAAFVSGLSAAGQPAGAAMLIYRGFGVGFSTAALYMLYGAKAVPAVLLLILPKAVTLMMIAFLAVRELMRSSSMLLGYISGKERDGERYSFRLYCIKFIVLSALCAAIASGDAAINYFFRSRLLT